MQLDLLQHGALAVTQTSVGQIQQRAGDFVGLAEDEIERRINVRRRQFFHAFQRFDPALGLTSLGRLSLEARDEFLHVRALRLLFVVGLLLLSQAFGAGAFEGAVAAAIQDDLLLLDVRDVIDHGVEEVPVVGNQQQGAGVTLEPVFQPQNGVEVQVVGRLIEQQQV